MPGWPLGVNAVNAREKPAAPEDIERQLHYLQLTGATAKEAIARVSADTGLPRREVYRAWLKLDKISENYCQSLRGAN